MKMISKSISFIVCILIAIMPIAGCSLLKYRNESAEQSKGDNIKESTVPKIQEITVYNDDTPVTYSVTVGDVAVIDAFTKRGYYFTGAYDSRTGGKKYFDAKGNSTMLWVAGNPDTYYARFESVETLSYSQIRYEEDPLKWDGGIYERYVEFELDEEFKNAVNANPDMKLSITVSLKISCDYSWEFKNVSVTNLKSGGESTKLDSDIKLSAKQYVYKTYTTEMSAGLFRKGMIYVSLLGREGANVTATRYYVKNVALSAAFVGNEQ